METAIIPYNYPSHRSRIGADKFRQVRSLADSVSDLGPLLWGRGPATTPEADAAHGGEAEEDTRGW